jgi:3-isopropylmalate/(R)-2-methylmalate dehydratase small subunit
MKPLVIEGRAFLIEKNGKLIEDIDTDQIYHNKYLHITDPEEMGKYAFSNLEGYKDARERIKRGDILVVGANFGAGSSRQHAVSCFISLGVSLILGVSFGAIYKRNAINSGLPILTCPELDEYIEEGKIKTGDKLEVNLMTGEIRNKTQKITFKCHPMGKVQREIYLAGNLFKYGKKQE